MFMTVLPYLLCVAVGFVLGFAYACLNIPMRPIDRAVLRAVAEIGGEPHAAVIEKQLNVYRRKLGKREIGLGKVWPSLDRLDGQRYLSSRLAPVDAYDKIHRGGHAKRIYRIEPRGFAFLDLQNVEDAV